MKEKSKGKKGTYIVLMLVCIAVFLFASIQLINIFSEYKKADDLYNSTTKDFTDATGNKNFPVEVDFDELLKVNDSVIGWIYMENTNINYPVLKGKTNNQFYLFRSYTKEYLTAGSIFADYRCSRDFSDNHMVIYGHNMHNGSMFGKLDKFTKETYKEKHPDIYILKPDGTCLRYEIYSAYKADVQGVTFELPLENEEKYQEFIDLTLEKNIYSMTIVPSVKDKILTLSTCTEDSDDYLRFVINAVLMEVIE